MVTKTKAIPEKGDIIWLSFSPTRGHEQSGRRPALVITPAAYNGRNGTLIACPITSKPKGYPFEVSVKTNKISGVVFADQVRMVDWRERKADFICRVSPAVTTEVIENIILLLKNE